MKKCEYLCLGFLVLYWKTVSSHHTYFLLTIFWLLWLFWKLFSPLWHFGNFPPIPVPDSSRNSSSWHYYSLSHWNFWILSTYHSSYPTGKLPLFNIHLGLKNRTPKSQQYELSKYGNKFWTNLLFTMTTSFLGEATIENF